MNYNTNYSGLKSLTVLFYLLLVLFCCTNNADNLVQSHSCVQIPTTEWVKTFITRKKFPSRDSNQDPPDHSKKFDWVYRSRRLLSHLTNDTINLLLLFLKIIDLSIFKSQSISKVVLSVWKSSRASLAGLGAIRD